MPKVRETARVRRSADVLWQTVGRFGAVGDWHPLLSKVENDGEEIGSLRRAQTTAGDRQVERLEALDEFSRCYRYAILAGPLAIRDCHAEFCIVPDGTSSSEVIWSAEFSLVSPEDAEAADSIRTFFQAGLKNIAKLYA